jgi:Zn-dependent protease with chaperone function
MVRELASAARVAEPRLVVSTSERRVARVDARSGGVTLTLQQGFLAAPREVMQGVLAHEVAHIARRDPYTRRRLRNATVAAIWVIAVSGIVVLSVLMSNTPLAWWVPAVPALLAALFVPRTVQLAILRRQEYDCDRRAAELLGGPGAVVAFLDWIPAHTRPIHRSRIARLWNATHPSPAARRRAVLARK